LENDELYARERVPSIVQVSPWESDTHRLLDFRRKIGVWKPGVWNPLPDEGGCLEP
jgi:hypothetical protein